MCRGETAVRKRPYRSPRFTPLPPNPSPDTLPLSPRQYRYLAEGFGAAFTDWFISEGAARLRHWGRSHPHATPDEGAEAIWSALPDTVRADMASVVRSQS